MCMACGEMLEDTRSSLYDPVYFQEMCPKKYETYLRMLPDIEEDFLVEDEDPTSFTWLYVLIGVIATFAVVTFVSYYFYIKRMD